VQIGAFILGIAIVLSVLWDTFETIVVPKTVRRRLRLTAFFYRIAWKCWAVVVKRMKDGPRRVTVLGSFGPLSLILLMIIWAALMVIGFGLIHYGAGTLNGTQNGDDFPSALYFSGTTFFTLGFGDVAPVLGAGRFWAVAEAGSGFGFLAVIIGYFPVLYQTFSRRENLIVLLDSKAGSDPSAGELLRRHAAAGSMEQLTELLHDWEVWSAQQLETFLSYPIMAYYRSQHDDQSWLNALTAILDTCAIIDGGFVGEYPWEKRLVFQAQATFAMARHVVVDLAYLLNLPPTENPKHRYSHSDWEQLKQGLAKAGIPLEPGGESKVIARRELYEPYVVSLARTLFFVLPAWLPEAGALDNWQTTAWDDRKHF
jgi:hypothetical protein